MAYPRFNICRIGWLKDFLAHRWQPLYLVTIHGLFCTNTSILSFLVSVASGGNEFHGFIGCYMNKKLISVALRICQLIQLTPNSCVMRE